MSKEKFNHQMVEDGVRLIIEGIGDDPDRDGLVETPQRVARMYHEILNGYDEQESVKDIVKLFDEKSEGMVVVRDVPFYSFCEHHFQLFVGKLSIAYIPDSGKILGVSKLIRIARLFAKQLQVQERLCEQINKAISDNVPNQGVAVRIEAEHFCMSIRGIRTPGVKMITTKLTGLFKLDEKARNEFLEAIR